MHCGIHRIMTSFGGQLAEHFQRILTFQNPPLQLPGLDGFEESFALV